MDRRDFLLGLIALDAAPLAAFSRQSGKVWRIGILSSATPRSFATRIEAFRAELRRLGYEEGRNLVLDSRWSDGKDELQPQFAGELVGLGVDLVVTHATIPSRAIRDATTAVPIVFATSIDVVESGFVASLARPGGNITGSMENGSPDGVSSVRVPRR